jgi:hypothetical protein
MGLALTEDLIVLPGVKAQHCDPMHEDLVITKSV